MKLFYLLAFSTLTLSLFYACQNQPKGQQDPVSILDAKMAPGDNFLLQRSYPDLDVPFDTYLRNLKSARQRLNTRNDFPGFENDWITRGPGNIGARVNSIAAHPTNKNIIYAGFSNGGLFKTINGGEDWEPVFDDATFLSIGDVVVDPQNPDVVYVGTGDPNISILPSIGDGLYRSEDAGETWSYVGLDVQRIVSQIVIHPTNSDIIYVGCMGLPFERNEDRGLYRSMDRGQTWEQVLFVIDQAGIIDIAMHPTNPDILYAASWDRIRNNQESIVVGPNAKIWRSLDGGDTWEMMTEGLPETDMSRIGLTVTPAEPDAVFAVYTGDNLQLENVYRSNDQGVNWAPLIDWDAILEVDPNTPFVNALGGFGWYFGKIRVNPKDPNDIFILGVDLWRTRDGGEFWFVSTPPWWEYSVHADKHDLIFQDSATVLLGTDGGVYQSQDMAFEWEDVENIPTTQFYRVAYNPHRSEWYYGGAQDNGTTGGPALDSIWQRIWGGDGFQAIFHPIDPLTFYAETQNGGIVVTSDGGATFQTGRGGLEPSDRRNWDMQYIMSPHNTEILYTGTYRVYRNTSGASVFWEPISEDLTDGLVLHPRFHSISTLSESPVVEGVLYVGTTDGNVWISPDAGATWESISEGLPDRYVTDIKASPDFEDYVYVTHSGYKDNEFIPRVHRSKDRGQTWEDISSNLPDLAVNDIYILPGYADTVLFIANDGGVYGTRNAGESWTRLGGNMPFIQVYDLEWNEERNELIAGTFARSILSFPIDSLNLDDPLVSTNESIAAFKSIKVYPSPATDWVRLEVPEDMPNDQLQIGVFNTSGQFLFGDLITKNELTNWQLNIQEYPRGMYQIRITNKKSGWAGRFVK